MEKNNGSNLSKESVNDKLTILYLLKSIDSEVTEIRLIQLLLDNRLMNYFAASAAIDDLAAQKLIFAAEVNGRKAYEISRKGEETLESLRSNMPPVSKNIIDMRCHEIKDHIKKETEIYADYFPESETQYLVKCRIKEGITPLFELNITVGTREDAASMCRNWEEKSGKIYTDIIKNLLD